MPAIEGSLGDSRRSSRHGPKYFKNKDIANKVIKDSFDITSNNYSHKAG